MTDNDTVRRFAPIGLGLVALLLLAGDTIGRIAPDRLPIAGHERPGEAIAAIAVPALYFLFGRLAADDFAAMPGWSHARAVRGLFGVFFVALVARGIETASAGVDPLLALGASLRWPDGSFAMLPGLALFVALAPALLKLRPFFVLGLGAGLFLSGVSTGIVPIDGAAALAPFFALGLVARRSIDGFVGAVAEERGEVMVCAAILVAVDVFLAQIGVATARNMALVLGFAGIAAALAFAAELGRTRAGPALASVGASLAVLLVAAELPLAVIGREPAGSTASALVAIVATIASAIAIARFSTWRARRQAALTLWNRAAAPG